MQRIGRLLLVVLAVATALVAEVGAGAGEPGAPASAAAGRTVAAASRYTPVGPVRLLDTRKPVGPSNPLTGAFGPGQVRELVVAGVPADATAVVLNVTVTGGTAASDLRLWPADGAVPATSNLNWVAGETVANLVTVGLGAGGIVAIRNQAGNAHVIVDLQGWWGPTGDGYTQVPSARILDSRKMPAPLGPAETWSVGADKIVPAEVEASAVVVNVTVTGGTASSDLRLWSTDESGVPIGQPVAIPTVSNMNWAPGETRANLAIVPAGPGGGFFVRNAAGTVHVIIDAVGYASPTGEHVLTVDGPRRVFDTRKPSSPLMGAFGPGEERSVTVVGGSVPADATAVVLNVTATGGTAASHVTVWPTGAAAPPTSALNWPAGATRPNLVIVPVGDDGRVSFRNHAGSVHLLADLVGWFRAPIDPGRWTDVPPPDDLVFGDPLRDEKVSCTSPTHCLASVNRFRTVPTGGPSATAWEFVAQIVEWDGEAWTDLGFPVEAREPDPILLPFGSTPVAADLSCGTPTSCAVLVHELTDDDTILHAAHWNGTTWEVRNIGIGDVEDSIECSADGTCRVVGGNTVWDGAEWITVPWTDPQPPDPGLYRAEVVCASATDCLAIGREFDEEGATSRVFQRRWDGTAWTDVGALPADRATSAPGAQIDLIPLADCASVDECLVVLAIDGGDARTLRWDGTRWSPVAPAPLLGDVSCVEGWCMAIGGETSPAAATFTWPDPTA